MTKDAKFNTASELIEDIKLGKIVILIDDEDRENEGDLVLASDHCTPEAINFMIKEARGLVCLSLTSGQIEKLQLPQMIREEFNLSPNKTAFTVSIEAATGVTTGISAADRSHTIKVAANPLAKPSDVHVPGHVFPLRGQDGGVLKRAGHTEGSIDLARLAGLNPAAVICEVINEDGEMSRVPDLMNFAKKHNLKVGTIVDLIEYRLANDSLVDKIESFDLPESFGANWKAIVFASRIDGQEHLVLQKGEVKAGELSLVRVHVDNYVRDILTMKIQSLPLISKTIEQIDENGSGVFLLLRGNNRANGLAVELKAQLGISAGPRPINIDQKDYGIGAQILRQLGVHKIKLLTNKPEKKVGLKAYDLEIVEIVPFKEN